MVYGSSTFGSVPAGGAAPTGGGVTQQGASNFSATATQTASGTRSVFAASSLSANSTISATAFNTDPGATFASTAATFTSTAFQTHNNNSSFSAVATQTASGIRYTFGIANYSADASLTGTLDYYAQGASDLTADASFSAAPATDGLVLRALHIATDGLLTGIQSLGAAVRGYLGGQGVVGVEQASANMIGNAFIQAFVPPDVTGTGYKNLWTNIRIANTPEVSVKSDTHVRTLEPDPHRIVRTVDNTPLRRIDRGVRVNSETPNTGVTPPSAAVTANAKVRLRKPKGTVKAPFTRAFSRATVNNLAPIPVVRTEPVSIRGKTYYSYWTPETVQNLPEEILMYL